MKDRCTNYTVRQIELWCESKTEGPTATVLLQVPNDITLIATTHSFPEGIGLITSLEGHIVKLCWFFNYWVPLQATVLSCGWAPHLSQWIIKTSRKTQKLRKVSNRLTQKPAITNLKQWQSGNNYDNSTIGTDFTTPGTVKHIIKLDETIILDMGALMWHIY